MISFDTETTGVDHFHGAKPFLATTCGEGGEVSFWEWDVDPYTREPIIPREDLDEVADVIERNDIVGQNVKFDAHATASILPTLVWPWERTDDTLIAAHLLASNQQKDLTTLALVCLGINIEPLELACKEACVEARRLVRTAPQFRPKTTMDLFSGVSTSGEWRIAKEGLPEMPSAKESTWKYDLWLPRAVAKHLGYADYHPWWRVCSEYANGDSQVTLPIFKRQWEEIEKRGLVAIYRERMRLPKIAWEMERRGITVSMPRVDELVEEYGRESKEAEETCLAIAAKKGRSLTLPKSGNNKSLVEFVFGEEGLALPPVKVSKATGNASLDKAAVEWYVAVNDENTDAGRFLRALQAKRKRDTALSYMESYRRYWLPILDGWGRMHPSLNITGTDTLRWSSSNPNEQNISKQEGFNLRYGFGPGPGREWWSLDAKNIELRIPTYECGEEEFIKLFERPDDGPYYGSNHLLIAHIVYPREFERCRDEQGNLDGRVFKKKHNAGIYHRVKCGNFCVQYGGQEALADATYGVRGAFKLINNRLKRQAELSRKWIAFAEKHGYVETMPDRSVDPDRGYPLLCSRVSWGGIKPTVPLNYHVQGTAMWWMARAMVRCYEQLAEWQADGLDAFIAMQVHDELVFDFPRGRGKEPWKTHLPKIAKLQKLMEQGGRDIGVPTPVSRTYHSNNWSEGEDI